METLLSAFQVFAHRFYKKKVKKPSTIRKGAGGADFKLRRARAARHSTVTPGRNDPPVILGRFAWLGVGLSHAHTIGRRGLRAHNQDHLLITRHGMFDCHRDAAGLWTPLALPLHYDASGSRKDVAILTINRRVAEIESAAMGTISSRIGNCIGEYNRYYFTHRSQTMINRCGAHLNRSPCGKTPKQRRERVRLSATGLPISLRWLGAKRLVAGRHWQRHYRCRRCVYNYGNRACMFTKQACYEGSWAALAFIMHHLHAGTASNTASVPCRESESVSTVQPAPGSCDQQGECETVWCYHLFDCHTTIV